MKLYTETEAIKKAKKIPVDLADNEVLGIVESMLIRQPKFISNCIAKSNWRALKNCVQQELNFHKDSKRIHAWKTKTGAMWDNHREKFIVFGENL